MLSALKIQLNKNMVKLNIDQEELQIILFPNNKVINNLISSAKNTILLSRQALPNMDFCSEIIEAKNRGVKIKILLSSPFYFKNLSANKIRMRFDVPEDIILYTQKTVPAKEKLIIFLKENGINIRYIDHKKYILNHSKYMVIDSKLAYVGSAPNESKKRLDIGILTDCPKKISTIEQLFKIDFYKKIYNSSLAYDNSILIAPDNMRNKVEQLLYSAKNSIDMLFPLITNDSKIFHILENKIKDGVIISAVCSPNIFSLNDSKILDIKYFIELIKIGVRLKFSYDPPIHCRVFIIDPVCVDNKKAYIGSGHLKTHCLDFNRETAIVTSQPKVIAQISDLFKNLWSHSEAPSLNELS